MPAFARHPQSAEFWNAFCDAQLEGELLRPFLPRLIPLLMRNMVCPEQGPKWSVARLWGCLQHGMLSGRGIA
jgi:hypothetical protein